MLADSTAPSTAAGETTIATASAADGTDASGSTVVAPVNPVNPENPELPGQTTAPGGIPASSTTPGTTASTLLPTATTADVEPSNAPLATNAPIPTSPEPPDTIGGTDADFLLGPRSVAGVQFGASIQTVLNRLTTLLGPPLTVQEDFADCANGTATAVQWYALGVIVTDRGLQYYTVGMATDMYEGLPVPGWHTSTGVTVGATTSQIQTAYPGQVTIGSSSGGFASFDITGGADAGLTGQLYNDSLQSLSGGSSEC